MTKTKIKDVIHSLKLELKTIVRLIIIIIFWIWAYILINALTLTEQEKIDKIKQSLSNVRQWIIDNATKSLDEQNSEIEELKKELIKKINIKNKTIECINYNNSNENTFVEPKWCDKFIKPKKNKWISFINKADANFIEWLKEKKLEEKIEIVKVEEKSIEEKVIKEKKIVKEKPESLKVNELFYTVAKKDKCRITQTEWQHLDHWGSMIATDVWCWFRSMLYAPSFKWKSVDYVIQKKADKYLWNYVELHFTEWAKRMKFILGHVYAPRFKSWDKIKTWEVLWLMQEYKKTKDNPNPWITTWYHSHIELWEDWINISMTNKSERLIEQRETLNQIKETDTVK